MTLPATCACGLPHLNGCAAPLRICIAPGFIFEDEIQLIDKTTGAAVNWPPGTTTRMRFSWGTGTELIVPGTVDGSYLRFALTAAETEQLPRGTLVTIDVNYDGGDPDRWRPWRQGRMGCP